MVYVGIDVSKASLSLFFRGLEKPLSISITNNSVGYDKIDKIKKKYSIIDGHACMEATGRYWVEAALYLYKHGWKVSVVNPRKIHGHNAATLNRQKTDSEDAKQIAEYCELYKPHGWEPLPEEIELLRELSRTRSQLVETKVKVYLQLTEKNVGSCKEILEQVCDNIKSKIKVIDDLIKVHVKTNETLKHNIDILKSIPGVGEVLSTAIFSEIPTIVNFENSRQLVSYAGISINQRQSGVLKGKGKITKVGSKRLRWAAYLCALTAIRMKGPLRDTYISLLSKGKCKKVALVAVARKILVLSFVLLKKQEKYSIQPQKSEENA